MYKTIFFITGAVLMLVSCNSPAKQLQHAVELYRSGDHNTTVEILKEIDTLSVSADIAEKVYFYRGSAKLMQVQEILKSQAEASDPQTEETVTAPVDVAAILDSVIDDYRRSSAFTDSSVVQEDISYNLEIALYLRSNLEQQQQEQDQKQQDQNSGEQDSSESGQAGNMAKEQEQLNEQTRQQSQSNQDLAQKQNDLAEKTEQMAEQTQNSELKEAAEQQRKAAEALEQNDQDQAREAQEQALEKLQNAEAEQQENENQDQNESSEDQASSILDQESQEQKQRQSLMRRGNINHVDRDW